MPDTRNRARIEIMNALVNFCLPKCFGPNSFSIHNKEWAFYGSHFDEQNPPINSLCMLNSAPFTKFYLGWLKEIKAGGNRYDTQYLIESIEDGQLCWWRNISIWHLPLETSNQFSNWKWTDAQFAFNDRWNKALKRKDAYITLGRPPIFDDKGGVTLGTRTRFGWDDYRPEKYFPNWKKITQKQMLEFYDECVANNPKKESQT